MYLGTSGVINNAHITLQCSAGNCSGNLRTRASDEAQFQFVHFNSPLELEWVECPTTKACLVSVLSLIVHASRKSGWQGDTIMLDADDKGSGKLIKYYQQFGFQVSPQQMTKMYGTSDVSSIVKSKRILKTIPMSLYLPDIKLLDAHVRKAQPRRRRTQRRTTRRRSSSRKTIQQPPRQSRYATRSLVQSMKV